MPVFAHQQFTAGGLVHDSRVLDRTSSSPRRQPVDRVRSTEGFIEYVGVIGCKRDCITTGANTHVRLNGVDAPELAHPGYSHDDDFGPESRDEMRRIIGDKIVRCEFNGERSYERLVGICFLPPGSGHGNTAGSPAPGRVG